MVLFFSSLKPGSSETTRLASFLAKSNIKKSSDKFARDKFKRPLCWVPIKFPGPLIFKSTSAILNPSEDSTKAFILSFASSVNLYFVIKIQ